MDRHPRFSEREKPEDLEDELARLLDKAGAYESLIQGTGWKYILDWLEARANIHLVRLRSTMSSDPGLITALARDWRQAEQILADLQNEVLGTIEQAKELTETLEERSKL